MRAAHNTQLHWAERSTRHDACEVPGVYAKFPAKCVVSFDSQDDAKHSNQQLTQDRSNGQAAAKTKYQVHLVFPVGCLEQVEHFLRKRGFPKLRRETIVIQETARPNARIRNLYMSPDNLIHRRVALIFKLERKIEESLREHCPSTDLDI